MCKLSGVAIELFGCLLRELCWEHIQIYMYISNRVVSTIYILASGWLNYSMTPGDLIEIHLQTSYWENNSWNSFQIKADFVDTFRSIRHILIVNYEHTHTHNYVQINNLCTFKYDIMFRYKKVCLIFVFVAVKKCVILFFFIYILPWISLAFFIHFQ